MLQAVAPLLLELLHLKSLADNDVADVDLFPLHILLIAKPIQRVPAICIFLAEHFEFCIENRRHRRFFRDGLKTLKMIEKAGNPDINH
ncbi:MAG TPA: hypothetical protein VMO20_08875 [Candidatus Acidoferrum sp.]|nr:hypothetical protein [Candidatus Acidoferrum sp.]